MHLSLHIDSEYFSYVKYPPVEHVRQIIPPRADLSARIFVVGYLSVELKGKPQFTLLSFKSVVPRFSIYYCFLKIRPSNWVIKRPSDTATYILTFTFISDFMTMKQIFSTKI